MFETYFGIEIEFSGITRRVAAELVAQVIHGSSYQLDVTSFLFSESKSFKVNVIDNDNIEIYAGSSAIQMMRVG